MRHVQPGEQQPVHPNDAAKVLVSGEESGGRFAIIELRLPGGTAPPRHLHAHEDVVVYVLAGHLTVLADDELYDAPAGTCHRFLRGTEHTFRVVSAEARLLVLVVPAGIEGYYRKLDQADAESAGVLDVVRLVATAAHYGVTITGPGLSANGRNGG
jgi:quercetin dioxygenase-like cupin family protein